MRVTEKVYSGTPELSTVDTRSGIPKCARVARPRMRRPPAPILFAWAVEVLRSPGMRAPGVCSMKSVNLGVALSGLLLTAPGVK